MAAQLLLLLLLIIELILPSKLYAQTKESTQGRIAFVSNRDGNAEIYLMDADGTHLLNLSNHDSLDFSPSWFPKQSKICFYSRRSGNAEIYSLDLKTREVQQLSTGPANDLLPVPSPNGKQILFISDRDSLSKNLYLMDIDGSNVRALTQNSFYEESGHWSPAGDKIVFTRQLRDPGDQSHAGNGEIFIMNADGTKVERLTFKDGYDSGANFSPDGKKIAFYGYNGKQWDLYIMNADGSELHNLTNDAIECYSPSWSAKGEWLVYTAGERGVYNIWKIHVDTGERIQLTSTQGRNEAPAWQN